MLRQPTPNATLYAWHSAAMRGEAPPTHEGEPQCGWFKTRIVKRGPWVAVRIWCDRDIDLESGELTGPEVLRCEVDGDRRRPESIWTFLVPISRDEYADLSDRKNRVAVMAATHAKIDLSKEPMTP